MSASLRGLCLALAAAVPAPATDFAVLDADLEALREAYGVPGFAISIVRDGRLVHARGFGLRDLERELPATPTTVFPIGSVTKQFTAALMGIYEGEGLLAFTDRPAQHIPDFAFRTAVMDELVTLEDLVTHQSGIGGADAMTVFFPTGDRDRHIRRLVHVEPRTGVRERFHYSNVGYAVLAAVGEHASGAAWEEELRKRIFAPLRMDASSVSPEALMASDEFATGYGMTAGRPHPGLVEDHREQGPSGAVNSTALDLANWIAMLLDQGSFEGRQVLPAAYLERAFSGKCFLEPSFDPDSNSLNLAAYGYGLFVNQFEGRYQVGHGGNVSGFSALVELLPGEALGVAVLSNQQNSGFPRQAATLIHRHLLGLERLEPDAYPVDYAEARPAFSADQVPTRSVAVDAEHPPTQALADFTGLYTHPGYGTFEVTLEGDLLRAHFPAFPFALVHEQRDVFRLTADRQVHENSPRFPVQFLSGFDGGVQAASIPLVPGSVRFERDLEAMRAELRAALEAARRQFQAGQDAEARASVDAALRLGLERRTYAEASLNELGYELLGDGEPALSVAVFHFTATAFPDSWNAHDSLGDALEAAGCTAEALSSFRRSLELNPTSPTGLAALERLGAH